MGRAAPSVAKATIYEWLLMYGLKPVPFDEGRSVVSRVAIERVRSISVHQLGGGLGFGQNKQAARVFLAGFS
jgi:hypothetical protein